MERFQFERGPRGSSAEEEAENLILHDTDLYDQNEDNAGERIDPATGKPIDNSTYTGMEDLSETDLDEQGGLEEDEAAKWLRENDPDQKQ